MRRPLPPQSRPPQLLVLLLLLLPPTDGITALRDGPQIDLFAPR